MINFRFSVKFFIKRTKLNSQGSTPINVQLKLDRQSLSFASGINIDPVLWNSQAQKAIGYTKLARNINRSLMSIHIDLENLYYKLAAKEDIVTITRIRNIFLGRDSLGEDHFLMDSFDKLIGQKQSLAKSKVIEEASADSYTCTRRKIIDFLKSTYHTKDINLKKINHEFVAGFEVYLLSDGNCSHNTMIRHMRRLKRITTDAYRNRYIDRDPFADTVLSVKKPEKQVLTEKELQRIIIQEFDNASLNRVRDMFLFCCMTGLSYIDLKHLKYSDITDNIIMMNRSKTKNPCFIPLLPIPLVLIEKYRSKKEYIFPVLTNKQMNDRLKPIGAACSIRKTLTMHTGRRTFATLMITKGMPIESIAKMLGHSDLKTTQIYAKILDQKILDEIDLVKDKLNDLTEDYMKSNKIPKDKLGKK